MKLIIKIYYLFFILVGGFRQFKNDYIFYSLLGNKEYSNSISDFLGYYEIGLIIAAFITVYFFKKPILHLLFGILLFIPDLYFQNVIEFISSHILPHSLPFVFWFYLKNKSNVKKIKLLKVIMIYFLATGYLTSGFSKLLSGWYDLDYLSVYDYILEINKAFSVNTVLGELLINYGSYSFWKVSDYAVLVYQFSFVLLFINHNLIRRLSLISICFHVIILLTMGIGVFYLYILYYAIIHNLSNETSEDPFKTVRDKCNIQKSTVFLLTTLLFIVFIYNSFFTSFFLDFMPDFIYLNFDYFLNFICILLFLISFFQQTKKNSIAQ